MFVANLIDLQFQMQTEKIFFRTDILNKTVTLMKLTKNLVNIPSGLQNGYLIGSRYLGLHSHDPQPLFPPPTPPIFVNILIE